jgi:hypothetical protein
MPDPDVGTTEGVQTDPGTDPQSAPDTAPATSTGTTEPKVESFIDPSSLPPELKAHWKSMHGAYTKHIEEHRAHKADLDMLARFRTDPEYAKQVLAVEAQRLGLPLGTQPSTTPSPATAPTAPAGIPQEFVDAIAKNLPAELKWMAPIQAQATWAAVQTAVAPIVQRTKQQEVSARSREMDDLEAELTQTAPGWEAHEADMNALLRFLQGPDLRDKRFGSKLAVLHRIVTGDAAATTAAIQRMGQAAQNRTTTGTPGRTTTSNLTDQIRGAKSEQEAWDLAAKVAVDQLKAQGVTV